MKEYTQLGFRVALLVVTCWSGVFGEESRGTENYAPLFPFVISHEAPDNVTSMAHLLDAPAGKHGFVRVENGHFATDAGRIRFHATNLTGPANFPSHAHADRLADRLARFGVNCVRFHYFDAPYGNFMEEHQLGLFGKGKAVPRAFSADPSEEFPFNREAVDCQDYLVAALKKRGIYVNMNLHVARFPKGHSFVVARMFDSEKEYARKLLTRVNPYTGLAYTDDPCIAMIEINNENALFNNYHSGRIDRLPKAYADEFRKKWNEWLKNKYSTTDALIKAWNWKATPLGDEQIPEGGFIDAAAVKGENWTFSLGQAKATHSAADGVLKIVVTKEGNEYFPKLFRNNLKLKQGEPYTLTFRIRRARADGDVTLGLAVAEGVGAWRSLGLHRKITVGAKWKTITYPFAASDDSVRAQFQLTRFKEGSYEVADLSLRSGARSDFDSTKRLEDGSIPVVKISGYAPLKTRRDFYRFMLDTERAYWTGIADYVRNELKAKIPISGTQLGYSPPFVQAELDYVDKHAYWCHPSPVSSSWRIRNLSMVNSLSCIQSLAAQRVRGKPYTVSEYNHPFPNQFGAEGQPMLRAYGALQGWDGVFEYTWHHRRAFERGYNSYFFSIAERSDVLAHMQACAAMYLRGDVSEAKREVAAAIDYERYFDRLSGSKAVAATIGTAGFDRRFTLVHKTGVELTGKAGTDAAAVGKIKNSKVIVSDTGELSWNMEERGAGFFAVKTPDTKFFCGYPKGRTIDLDGVTLRVGETRLGWAAVSLTSQSATGFGEAGGKANILLAATGVSENSGQKIKRITENEISTRENWGHGPVMMEGVPATLTLPSEAVRTKCFALNPRGDRTKEVPVEKMVAGGSKIVIGPQYRTVWYEIEVK